MESYVQIENEAAVKMILDGNYNELWFKNDGDIVKCKKRNLYVHALPDFKFFVKLSDDK